MSDEAVRPKNYNRKKPKVDNEGNAIPSNRVLVLHFLAKRRGGAVRKEIVDEVFPTNRTCGQLGIILRGEQHAPEPGIRCDVEDRNMDGTNVYVYYVTRAGKNRLEKGIVDSYAREHHLMALGRGAQDAVYAKTWDKIAGKRDNDS